MPYDKKKPMPGNKMPNPKKGGKPVSDAVKKMASKSKGMK